MTRPLANEAAASDGTAPKVEQDQVRQHISAAVSSGAREVALTVNANLRTLGATLVEGVPGAVTVRFQAHIDDLQGGGVVGGGVIANMLDSAIAIALLSALAPGQGCATISLTINMVAAARPGPLTARASVDKLGQRVAFARADLFDANDTLLATAVSSLAVLAQR